MFCRHRFYSCANTKDCIFGGSGIPNCLVLTAIWRRKAHPFHSHLPCSISQIPLDHTSHTETDCLERLWNLLHWKYSRTTRMQSCATCSGMIMFEQGDWTRWPALVPSNLIHSLLLGFYDTYSAKKGPETAGPYLTRKKKAECINHCGNTIDIKYYSYCILLFPQKALCMG